MGVSESQTPTKDMKERLICNVIHNNYFYKNCSKMYKLSKLHTLQLDGVTGKQKQGFQIFHTQMQ